MIIRQQGPIQVSPRRIPSDKSSLLYISNSPRQEDLPHQLYLNSRVRSGATLASEIQLTSCIDLIDLRLREILDDIRAVKKPTPRSFRTAQRISPLNNIRIAHEVRLLDATQSTATCTCRRCPLAKTILLET